MKQRFVFNPRSGRPKRNAPILPALKEFIRSRSLDADLVSTEGPGHATEITREAVAAGCQCVVAVGGDGTVNEVAQALIHTPAAMGLVPCGSGNGLALHLGIPSKVSAALECAAGDAGRVAELDTGIVNGRPFVNAMGLGLDADVGRRFNLLTRRGLPAYTKTALAAFFTRKTERCTITCNGTRETVDMLFVAIANSDQYGNNAKIAPGARVDDGLLDMVIVRPMGVLGACALGARLFLGTIDKSRDVAIRKSARFVIERPAKGVIHTDGETHVADALVEIQIRPRSLKFMVPLGCTAVMPTTVKVETGFALQLP